MTVPKKYAPEFKADVVRLARDRDVPIEQFADDNDRTERKLADGVLD